jgi:hypothetical protein
VVLGGFTDASEFTKVHQMGFQSAVAQTCQVSPGQVNLGSIIEAQASDMRWARRLASGISVPYTISEMNKARMESAKHALEAVAAKPVSFQRTLSNQLSAAHAEMPEGGMQVAASVPVASSYSPAPTPVPTRAPTLHPTAEKDVLAKALDSVTIGGIVAGGVVLLGFIIVAFSCGRASKKSEKSKEVPTATSFDDLEGSLAEVSASADASAGAAGGASAIPMALVVTNGVPVAAVVQAAPANDGV